MIETIPIYTGFDQGEAVGFHVFCHSVLSRSSEPVSFHPVHPGNMRRFYDDHNNTGTNAFNRARFLVPALHGHYGWAIFADGSDMLCMADIAELWGLADFTKAVMVVKHDYETQHPRKYIGTKMEADNVNMHRKNWSSLMLINCGHFGWQRMTPGMVSTASSSYLHQFHFLKDNEIGELPPEWNHLVGEYPKREVKLAHYTLGIPAFGHYRNCDYSGEWFAEKALMGAVTDVYFT